MNYTERVQVMVVADDNLCQVAEFSHGSLSGSKVYLSGWGDLSVGEWIVRKADGDIEVVTPKRAAKRFSPEVAA